jgi:dihydrolipoamide dehydrogenase
MHDIAIIGAGPGGVACAREARKYGFHPLLIDKKETFFGGICLNRGCIPSKYLVNARKQGRDWPQALKEKDTIVRNIRSQGIQSLQKQGVEIIWGEARFLDKNSLEVNGEAVVAKHIIIATGSRPNMVIENPQVTIAEEIVRQENLSDRYLIVGAGYIGIEMASLLKSYGKEVHLVEKEKSILNGFDPYLANRLRIVLQKKGMRLDLEKDLKECDLSRYDKVVSATGRSPAVESLGLKNIGVTLTEKGFVKTNEFMATNIDNIYACGDVTGKNLLAYTAEYQGRLCIENIKKGPLNKENYEALPFCVFSSPALAVVGILGDEARRRGIEHRVLQTNFLKFSSSYVYDDLDGFLQIVVDSQERVIGAGIISNAAGELISMSALCVQNKLALPQLRKLLLIHPTLSEVVSSLFHE